MKELRFRRVQPDFHTSPLIPGTGEMPDIFCGSIFHV